MLITTINCISLSLTIAILVTFYEPFQVRRFSGYFLICFSIDLIMCTYLQKWGFLSPHIMIPCIAAYMNLKRRNVEESILYSLIVMLTIAIQTYAFGSCIALFFYKEFATNNMLYNLLFAVMNVIVAFMIRFYKDGKLLNIQLKEKNSIRKALIFCIVYFVFVTLVLRILPIHKDILSYSFVIFALASFTIYIRILVCNISLLEMKSQKLELQNEFYMRNQEELSWIQELKHYYLRLFRYCIENIDNVQARSYFEEISQGLNQENKNIKQLEYIENEQIRKLLMQVIHDVALLPNIKLHIELTHSLYISDIKEWDLFKILSSLLDNALEAVQQQEKGFIDIYIHSDDDHDLIKIVNSYNKEQKKGSFGVGQQNVRKILAAYQCAEFEAKELAEIYIQTLVIVKRRI